MDDAALNLIGVSVLREMDAPVAILDQSACFLFTNKAFSRWSGYGSEALVGSGLRERFHLSSVENVLRTCRSVSGSIPVSIESLQRSQPLHCRFSCMREGASYHFLIQGQQRDNDQFLKINSQMDLLNTSLSKQRSLARRYKATSEGIERFVEVLMHDIRSPINTIVSAMDLAQEDLSTGEMESLQNMLKMGEASSHRLSNLVDKLYSALRQSEVQQRIVAVELHALFEALNDDLKCLLSSAGAELTWNTDVPTLRADRTILRQLLQNLLQNAIKFRADSRSLQIRVHCKSDEAGGLCLQVEDNGIGFDPKVAEGLFERFYKVNSRSNDGLGLGLSICKQIADKHGWEMRAQSVLGQGARFSVYMPEGTW